MCTLVCRWQPDAALPVVMLALRDELRSREFDNPAGWWPEFPNVVGGRDRRAGGSWCVTDVACGTTAVVLNRPEKRTAAPGAPSRGALPLLATRHGSRWSDHVDVAAMAGFNLVLAAPDGLHWWSYDGQTLRDEPLPAGTAMFAPTGRVDPVLDARLLTAPSISATPADPFAAPPEQAWRPWLDVVRQSRPTSERSGLLVRRAIADDSYETVFGQFLATAPGWLRVDFRRAVATDPGGPWTTQCWPAPEQP
jgi:hypothetical protein